MTPGPERPRRTVSTRRPPPSARRFAAQPLVSARLKQVTTTWNYIEKPLLHYKEKSVPFVVVRYSDKIVAGLTAGERVEAAR